MLPRELRELGRGSFGRVFLGHDVELDLPVAVKQLHDPSADADRFRREAELLIEQRSNPHVVHIFRYDAFAPQPYIVMEYCEGGSLRGRVGAMGWEDTANALLHAARGLLGIHLTGGFHRDLKPDNLLLASSLDGQGYVVKIGDFGLARRPKTAMGPMTRTPGGTEGYMAPELYRPGAQFAAPCDIYSLGIIGIELLTGQLTSAALTGVAIPTDLRNLLLRMASPLAVWRPTAESLVSLLEKLVVDPWAGDRAAPPAPSPAPRAAPAAKGNGVGWWLLGLAGAAAVAVAASDSASWDSSVGRYRGPDGRFR